MQETSALVPRSSPSGYLLVSNVDLMRENSRFSYGRHPWFVSYVTIRRSYRSALILYVSFQAHQDRYPVPA